MIRKLAVWLVVCLACCAVWAQGVQPVPTLTARVMDHTATLSGAQLQGLEGKLAVLEQDLGTQLVVLMVASTQPEDIAAYAQRVADSWKIGRKQVGDGLLVVVAKNDRRVRIEVAKALEGAIPDLAASRIIESAMLPRFKQGDFAGGLNAGVDQLRALAAGEGLPAPRSASKRPDSQLSGSDWLILVFVLLPIVFRVLSSVLGRKLGALSLGGLAGGLVWLLTASTVLAGLAGLGSLLLSLLFGLGGGRRGDFALPVMWGGGSRGGWGGGGFGGGFGSGGGGNFGGGGASGHW